MIDQLRHKYWINPSMKFHVLIFLINLPIEQNLVLNNLNNVYK